MIVRGAKLWLIKKGIGESYFSFSRDLTVHTAALRKLILQDKTTPEELGTTIFHRAINFQPAVALNLEDTNPKRETSNTSKTIRPHSMNVDKQAIKEYKALIASLPADIRKKWDEAVAQKLIDLGKAFYELEIFGQKVNAPLIELSFEVSKLLNELGLR